LRLFGTKTPPVMGLDIGSSSIRLVQLSRAGASYRIDHFAIEPLPPGVIVEKSVQDIEAISDAIRAAVRNSGSGSRFCAVAVSGSAVFTKTISLPANLAHFDAPLEALGILRTDHPHYYRGGRAGESEARFVDRITGNLEQLILDEGPETIAAFIAEPVTGASGVIVPPAGYYEKVQAILDKYDILFWADEVITGFGRTGKLFGCETMNIREPAQMTFAKQLSSAYYPISASVIRGDLYEAMVEPSAEVGIFGHGYTYSGHPVACAAALKALEIYERDGLYANAAEMGAYLQSRLGELADHEAVGEVRGVGVSKVLHLKSAVTALSCPIR